LTVIRGGYIRVAISESKGKENEAPADRKWNRRIGQNRERETMKTLIQGGYSGKAVRVEKGGDQKDDMIYNRDVAQGLYLACTAPTLHYDAYNIGMGVGYTLKDVANEVKRIIPKADIQIGGGLHFLGGPSHDYSVYDITRAREDLGFSRQFTLGKAIEDYIETLKKLGL
jgi:UDP-glucuronate 4-epimerase